MTMEERIKADLAKLAQQKEQTLAQLNAILGAEQALRQLLEPEAKEEPQ
jgi:predicted secreted protein